MCLRGSLALAPTKNDACAPTLRCVRWIAVAVAVLAAIVVSLPALALDVTGTNGDDSLRGTAKADKINGRAGNDRIVGLRGNDTLIGGRGRDVLYGGPGDDRLLIRDGAKDSADCGSGRDTVIADKDFVRGNCETVLRPFPNVPPGP
jgi:RTX calcium-binding nonapeptide repeat (4 copies)